MSTYELPPLPSYQRWYLDRTSAKYADLKLQQRKWWGSYRTLTYETINTSGKYRPVEECLKSAAYECLLTMAAPKPEYGVIT